MAAVCRSCHAPVRWVRLAISGSRMPLDPEPNAEKGNVHIANNDDQKAVLLSGPVLDAARDERLDLYVSHFATCPNAKEHRRG